MLQEEILNELKDIKNLLRTQKDVLNIDEASVFTGLAKSTLYKATMSKTIPFYKKAKHVFFEREELIKWLKETKIN